MFKLHILLFLILGYILKNKQKNKCVDIIVLVCSNIFVLFLQTPLFWAPVILHSEVCLKSCRISATELFCENS